VSHVKESCAFLKEGMGRIDGLEEQVHGRRRKSDEMVWPTFDKETNGDVQNYNDSAEEELRFGVLSRPIMLATGKLEDSQWTGCVTGIALAVLESGMVDAVVCIASEQDSEMGWSKPEPILARTKEEILKGRKVKPSLAPSLRVLDEIQDDDSIKKLLFCGVGCAVQAFRSVQDKLGLDEIFVLGTNCADNSPTPTAAQDFLREGLKVDETKVQGYEFMQDFRVHVKMGKKGDIDQDYITKPYFCLPGKVAEGAIAKSCLACFDYTNSLADVVVGYMGAPLASGARMDKSFQTIAVRNDMGERMIDAALQSGRIEFGDIAGGSGGHEKMASATVAADSIILAMTGGDVKQEGMPMFVGGLMAMALTKIGPKGMNFARYSIDYHILRNYLHVLLEWGEDRAQYAIPVYAKDIVKKYLDNDKSFADLKEKILVKREIKEKEKKVKLAKLQR